MRFNGPLAEKATTKLCFRPFGKESNIFTSAPDAVTGCVRMCAGMRQQDSAKTVLRISAKRWPRRTHMPKPKRYDSSYGTERSRPTMHRASIWALVRR